ncbi:MAG: hypothetical protein KGJ98_07965 [Chloroflexota bacterium]|nr:hypothetical protein [Chloroflexota bacterium]MDE3102158.1 hypothetical protein [Chloroflexota bacterium]
MIYIPATWHPLDPAVIEKTTMTFAASPDSPSAPLDDHLVMVAIRSFRRDPPFASAGAFADALQSSVFTGVDITREPGTLASGDVVFLRYVHTTRSGRAIAETDALFVNAGVGWILSTEAPVEQWQQYAPTFRQVFERFRPA